MHVCEEGGRPGRVAHPMQVVAVRLSADGGRSARRRLRPRAGDALGGDPTGAGAVRGV